MKRAYARIYIYAGAPYVWGAIALIGKPNDVNGGEKSRQQCSPRGYRCPDVLVGPGRKAMRDRGAAVDVASLALQQGENVTVRASASASTNSPTSYGTRASRVALFCFCPPLVQLQ